MADLDAVHLGLDENEADIAEELQHFDDSFDTRSEASESGSESSDSQPSMSSVSSTHSSKSKENQKKTKKIEKPSKETDKKTTTKRSATTTNAKDSSKTTAAVNGKSSSKKKKDSNKTVAASTESVEQKIESANDSAKNSLRKKSIDSAKNASKNANTSGSAKSEASDDEAAKAKAKPATFDSDSESEDSDSGANTRRNGRKNTSKSASPEKKIANSVSGSGAGGKTVSSYDYKTKLNYLFRDTRFFLIKSNNADNVGIAKSKNVWATLPQNDANLTQAFKEARNVLLIYSVNESGKFAGFARMSAASRRDIPQPPWVLPPSISSKALGGVIEIDWICRKELSFNCTSHLYNSWNEGKPVKIGRDGQEIEPKVGAELCRLFPEDDKIELTPILRTSKDTAKMMREKGIRVVYKAPKSLSSRGGGGRGSHHYRSGGGGIGGGLDRRDGGGPMRHKRTFVGGPHRPYKLPYMGHAGGGYKRGGSPFGRGGPGGGPGGSGSSRAGGGDSSLPPWERFMTPTAAAEAYLADYMRTMHGQLPPLPFAPPFGQLPPPTSGGPSVPPPGMPGSMYEQLPPTRYYDGPPLPDYPPPQPMRPPPPGYDKGAPSFEDFAAWKHAGLPTGALPPGFPNNMPGGNGGGSGSASTGGGSSAAGGSSNSNYRGNRNISNSSLNRSRDRPLRGHDFHHRGGGSAGGSSRSSGGDRDRHFRPTNERSSGRNYRDNRR